MNGTTGYNNRSSQRCERECIRCRPGSHQRNRQFFLGGGWTSSNLLWSTGISSVCKKNITQVAVVMRAFAISNSSLLLQRSRSTLLSSTVVVSERPAWAASYMSESLTNVQSAGAGLQQQDQEHGRTVTRTPVAWESIHTTRHACPRAVLRTVLRKMTLKQMFTVSITVFSVLCIGVVSRGLGGLASQILVHGQYCFSPFAYKF